MTRQAETAVAAPTRFLVTDGALAGSQVGISTAAQMRTALNVEDGATADQTNAEIKTAYEANADTNAFLDAEKTRLERGTIVATAIQTSAYTAVTGDLVLTDSTGAAFIVTLPATPSVGDVVGILDVTGQWTTNNVTVARNATNIEGAAVDLVLDGGRYAELRYASAGRGWVLNFVSNAVQYEHPNHTGDVTSTGDGATAIAAGAIVDADVNANAAIAFSKLAGVAATTVGQGQQHFFVPAGSMIARTTSGAAAGTAELATNDVMLDYMAFDAVADEHAQFAVQMPKRWNEGTIVAQFIWSHPATTTNFGVAFFLQAVAFANDDAMDAAFGTAVGVTDTGGTTDDAYITAETAAITVAGTPGDEEYVIFQVYRDVSDAGDTMAVDARLHGVKIHWTSNAATDD